LLIYVKECERTFSVMAKISREGDCLYLVPRSDWIQCSNLLNSKIIEKRGVKILYLDPFFTPPPGLFIKAHYWWSEHSVHEIPDTNKEAVSLLKR
jgi:hypothetical protein